MENYKFNFQIKVTSRGFYIGYLCPVYFTFLYQQSRKRGKNSQKEKAFCPTTPNYRFSIFQQQFSVSSFRARKEYKIFCSLPRTGDIWEGHTFAFIWRAVCGGRLWIAFRVRLQVKAQMLRIGNFWNSYNSADQTFGNLTQLMITPSHKENFSVAPDKVTVYEMSQYFNGSANKQLFYFLNYVYAQQRWLQRRAKLVSASDANVIRSWALIR